MFISFYSYKGGVGRTQLCANIASYLCFRKHMKVLLWDWDFEAPGLHRYFKYTDEEIISAGTLEILESYITTMRKRDTASTNDLKYINKNNIIPLKKSSENGKIDLIPAGNYSEDYPLRLTQFNWLEFVNEFDGIVYLKELKKRLDQLNYDFILIDSRTGLSDYAGICNVLMPNANVVVVSPNDQNFDGCKRQIDRIINHPFVTKKYRDDFILPILSRLDTNNSITTEIWIKKFIETFSYVIPNLFSNKKMESLELVELINQFLENSFLPYTYSISTGENILFEEDNSGINIGSFKKNYANIAEYLLSLKNEKTIFSLQPLKIKKHSLQDGINALNDAMLYQNENQEEFQGLLEISISIFKEVIKKEPTSYVAWLKLTEAFLGIKDYRSALEAIENAIKIEYNSAELWTIRGNCFIEMELYHEAEESLDKAIEIEPNYYTAKYYQGRTLLENGKKEKGLKMLNSIRNEASRNKHVNPDVFYEFIGVNFSK